MIYVKFRLKSSWFLGSEADALVLGSAPWRARYYPFVLGCFGPPVHKLPCGIWLGFFKEPGIGECFSGYLRLWNSVLGDSDGVYVPCLPVTSQRWSHSLFLHLEIWGLAQTMLLVLMEIYYLNVCITSAHFSINWKGLSVCLSVCPYVIEFGGIQLREREVSMQ